MSTHIHAIGPKRAGRPTLDIHRCVRCGLSTKNDCKSLKCSSSDSPGGNLCHRCIPLIDPNLTSCFDWISLESILSCDNCLVKTDQIMSCMICDKAVCSSCLDPISLTKFYELDICFLLCSSCIPFEFYSDDNNSNVKFIFDRKHCFCHYCQDYHLSENSNSDVPDSCSYCDNGIPPIIRKILSKSPHQATSSSKEPNSISKVADSHISAVDSESLVKTDDKHTPHESQPCAPKSVVCLLYTSPSPRD